MQSRSLRREPQQLRGQRRIEQILDAADALFVEVGFEAATTNAIAARAETSIGSLYQFFPNKDAILNALAERHLANMRAVNARLLTEEVAGLPFPEGLYLAIDTLAEYHAANPGFRLLFCGAMTTGQLARSADELHREIAQGAEGVLHRLPARARPVAGRAGLDGGRQRGPGDDGAGLDLRAGPPLRGPRRGQGAPGTVPGTVGHSPPG